MTSTDLAKTGASNLPALGDYAQYAGAGFDNQTSEDIAVPFINILQSNSPQVVDELPGATAGKLINSVTGDIYDELDFVPSLTDHMFVEWKPRSEGGKGGFVGTHPLESDVVKNSRATQEFGEFQTDAGNDLVDTYYVYGIAVDKKSGVSFQAAIAYASTKVKKYKAWSTKARLQVAVDTNGRKQQLPLFAFCYTIKTVKEENKHGKFYNFTVPDFANGSAEKSRLAPDSELFQQAALTYTAVKGGTAKVDHAAAAGGTGTTKTGGDKEIPF